MANITPNAARVRSEVRANFAPPPGSAHQVWPVGFRNCRHIASDPSRNWSQHAEGNATDIMKLKGTANAKAGVPHDLDPIFDWLVTNKQRLGIKNILWRVAAHFNHIHVDFLLAMKSNPTYVPPCKGGELVTILFPDKIKGDRWLLHPDESSPLAAEPPGVSTTEISGTEAPMLKRKDQGRAVADIQRDLIEIHGHDLGDFEPFAEGYPPGADGDFGSGTEDSVRNFQVGRDLDDISGVVLGRVDALTASLILGAQRNELIPTGSQPP